MTDRSRCGTGPRCVRYLLAGLLMLLPLPAAMAGGSADWLFPPFRADPPALKTGEAAPPLEWIGPDGSGGSLQALKGEVVVVVFWASWCPWCRRLWPVLSTIAEDHPARPQLLPVNVWDEADAAATYAARPGFMWPLRIATEEQVERWHIGATPHTVVIDAAGRVSGVVSGFDPEGSAIRAALDRSLLQEDAP